MAAPANEPDFNPSCPVLLAWQGSVTVMNRMMQGQVVYLPPGATKLNREILSENVDLLGPLINQLGYSAQAVSTWTCMYLAWCNTLNIL